MRRRSSKLLQKLWKLPRALRFGAVIFNFFDDFKICVAPENKGDMRASYAVPQVALNSKGSLDVGWDMTDHRKRGAPSGSVNFVFVSCGTAVHLERHENIRNIFCGTSVYCCCCCCFSHSAYWLSARKKLLYTVANPARGLLNREKRT